jgi:hypothetical protein
MRSRRLLEAIDADLQGLKDALARDSTPGRQGSPAVDTPEEYDGELEDLRAQVEALRQSESFRIGHRIVSLVRPRAAFRARRRRRGKRTKPSRARRATKEAVKSKRFPVPPGKQLLGPLSDRHSTTMFLVWGYQSEELESLIDEVARLQLMLNDFKPLFVTDSTYWSAFHRHGYWFEYIPPADEWMRYHEPTEWPDYVSERIESIVATYLPDRLLVFENGDGLGALKRGVLNRLVTTRPRQAVRPILPPEGQGVDPAGLMTPASGAPAAVQPRRSVRLRRS